MANQKWKEFIEREIYLLSVREKRRIKNIDFAEYLGVDPTYVSHWLKGYRVPTEDVLDRVANLLGSGAYEAAGKNPRLPNNAPTRRIAAKLHRLPVDVQEQVAAWVEEAAKKTAEGQEVDRPHPGQYQMSFAA